MSSSQVKVGRARAAASARSAATLEHHHERFPIPDLTVSNNHALVDVSEDGTVSILDLGSRNGSRQVTSLRNQVLSCGLKYAVEHKDVFFFGSCPVLFILHPSEVADAAEAAEAAANLAQAEALAHDFVANAASSASRAPPPLLAPDSTRDTARALNQYMQDIPPPADDCSIDSCVKVDKDALSSPASEIVPDDQPDYIFRCTNTRKGMKKILKNKLRAEKFEKWGKALVIVANFLAVMLASMLSVLVPQECGDQGSAVVCTIEDNLDWDCWHGTPFEGQDFCLSNFNKFVLVWNCFLVLCCAVLYWYEYKREKWLSKHLDKERTQLADHLVHTQFWEARGHECKVISLRLFYAYLITLIVFLFNVIVSGLLVLAKRDDAVEKIVRWNDGHGGYYLDYKTITVFYSNVCLLFVKLVTGTYYLFRICLEKTVTLHLFGWEIMQASPLPWGLSSVNFEPISYNVVAPEICLQEMGAKGDLVGSWRLRRPNGKSCPHVPRIAPQHVCDCAETMPVEIDEMQPDRGFIPMIIQNR